MRDHYNVNFIFLIDEGSKLPSELAKIASIDDQIFYVPTFMKLCVSGQFENDFFRVARNREEQHSAYYLRDILQQERDFAGMFVVGAQRHLYSKVSQFKERQIYGSINFYFDFVESIFEGNNIRFSIVWPRTAFESVVTFVSKRYSALVTFPYVSKGEGNLIYWADGAFASGDMHLRLYDDIEVDKTISISSIVPPTDRASVKRSDAKHIYSAVGCARQIYVITRDRLSMFVLDLIRSRKANRISYLGQIANVARKFFFHRNFIKLDHSVPGSAEDYALFTFQNEPEFAVQGRCKEFNDQIFLVRSLALNLPAGITLYIKEHAWIGNRDIAVYEQLLRLPNVKMLPFHRNASDFIVGAKFVASLNGSILFEAAIRGVAGIALSTRSEFLCLKSVHLPKSIYDLQRLVCELCEEKSADQILEWKLSAKKYLSLVRKISFDGTPLFTHPKNPVSEKDMDKAFQSFCKYIDLRNTL